MSTRILVFSREPSVLKVFGQLLKSQGYKHVVGLTELCSLHEVRAMKPDIIVLLDVIASEADPEQQFLQSLKIHPTTGQIPIILRLPSTQQGREMQGVLGDNRVYILPEPFTFAGLLHAIQTTLEATNRPKHRA